MAVVQVSRIQQRRGRKLAGTGFPQLASGEIGWAVDTQELYIGNGSVSEGAPYVGNTQILTENVNILDFAKSYQYKINDPTIRTGLVSSSPIQRTIQDRLDDYISVRSFGVKGNGIQDDTIPLQRAIDQLFLNSATKETYTNRVILYLEPGEYIISDHLRIPPYAHLVGAGIDSTVIKLIDSGVSGPVIRMVDSNSTPGSYTDFNSMSYLKRPRHVLVQSMTLQSTINDSIVYLDNTDSSIFSKVKFLGTYNNGQQPVETSLKKQTGIWIRSSSEVFRSENVYFDSCVFNKTGFGIYSVSENEGFTFHNCKFYQLYDGINLGYKNPNPTGNSFNAINNKFTNCHFDLVDRYGIWIKNGYGNSSSNNKYLLVGNNNQGYSNPTYPNIRYDTPNNLSQNDYFERNTKLKDQTLFGAYSFVPSIQTTGLISDPTNYKRVLDITSNPIEFFRFPLFDSATYYIDYVINKTTNGSAIRTGRIHITASLVNSTYTIQDDFSYTGNSNVESIQFSVTLEDYNQDAFLDTLVLRLTNPISGTGTVNYSYHMITQ